ncbi:uncharacterized protein LOC131683953 [Topomyia yanbarensis]|uniref:uncharacterized protein LOC131683953 n=1 Tax=Topomyia yanbarensis TaxID=2498891 RepID=UPI00273AB741|nr:uncharacterized protein LOC131683953 [Topomyia yanbarensis]
MSAKRELMKPEESVPKKFFRYTLKGAYFYGIQTGEGCSLDDLVAYTYLKNKKEDRPETVQSLVKQTTTCLQSQGLLTQTDDGKYHLTHAMTNFSTVANDPSDSPNLPGASSTEQNDPGSKSSKPDGSAQSESSFQSSVNHQPETEDTPSPTKSHASSDSGMDEPTLLDRKGKAVILPKHRQHSDDQQGTSPPPDAELMPKLMPLSFDYDQPDEDASGPGEAGCSSNLSVNLPELTPLARKFNFLYSDDDSD